MLENIKTFKSKHNITTLSNISAYLYANIKDINWCGFYLYLDNKLILGPFQGEVACEEIQLGKGVCGTSAKKDEIIIVPNVFEFEGHIACSDKSRSEVVVPIHLNNKLYGVLDIDAPIFNRFDNDKDFYLKLAKEIEGVLNEKTDNI